MSKICNDCDKPIDGEGHLILKYAYRCDDCYDKYLARNGGKPIPKVGKATHCEECGEPLSAALQSVGLTVCGPCRGVIPVSKSNKKSSLEERLENIERHNRGYGRDGYIGDVGGYD